MRKPRDYDSELKALEDKARELKTRKVQQLGELVIATGADSLSTDELAGALVAIAENKEAGRREAWAKRGAAFFHGKSRRSARADDGDGNSARTQSSGTQPASGGAGAT
ncbi:conjugal transfer protein TraD [Aminobacter sp. BE322]|uniref:conjugal transfer protein TraD n=1 Tax=unclassified Aminobacter TaxID=2644704 RepID=UPI003D2025A6